MQNTRDVCEVGIGVALFVALSLCLRVPVFENYYLCLGYVVMIVYCYFYGATKGALVGAMGTMLYCVLIDGLRGMPGWAIGNFAIGVILGVWFEFIKRRESVVLTIATVFIIVMTTGFGILFIKSAIECVLYSQPMIIRIISNGHAFVSDIVMLVIGLPVCYRLRRILIKRDTRDA